ncbi:hypothetical protein [Streptomyces canus]|uniref:hypothetical protein n=1 Tax=Streptomyces canus TaxID=58343 RepID=UPI0032482D8D
MRTLYADWSPEASLVGELPMPDKDFGQRSGGRQVPSCSLGMKRFHHRVAGELAPPAS